MRTYSTIYVAPDDRKELAALLNLSEGPSETWLWRLTEHLLFGTSVDEDTGAVLLDHRTLGVLADRSHRSGRHRAYDLIQEYRERTGIQFNLTIPDALRGKARTAESISYPSGVEEIAGRMRRSPAPLPKRIAFDTGEPWSPTVGRSHRLAAKEEALEASAKADNPDALRLLNLLNCAPSNRWAKVADFITELRSAADELPPESREYALNVIARVEVQPMPFFAPAEKTSRIYSIGTSVLGLPRELRKELVRLLGWRTLDLKSAQLAVIARVWHVLSVQEFLETGESFWSEMLRHLGLGDEHKPQIKSALYALVFGESERKAKERMLAAFPDGEALWRLWRSHRMISDLYRARKRVIATYQRDGGALDAYGKWWPVRSLQARNERGQAYGSTDVRSVMATVAQSYELRMLAPVIDIAEASDRHVQIMYWLHDGFALSVPPSRPSIVRTMQEAVNANARQLGILTELQEE